MGDSDDESSDDGVDFIDTSLGLELQKAYKNICDDMKLHKIDFPYTVIFNSYSYYDKKKKNTSPPPPTVSQQTSQSAFMAILSALNGETTTKKKKRDRCVKIIIDDNNEKSLKVYIKLELRYNNNTGYTDKYWHVKVCRNKQILEETCMSKYLMPIGVFYKYIKRNND